MYKRYARPEALLNQMIQVGTLANFIDELYKTVSEELVEEKAWSFYLHKTDGITYAEYRRQVGLDKEPPIDASSLGTTIRKAKAIAENHAQEAGQKEEK